jgi:hypothetical protein
MGLGRADSSSYSKDTCHSATRMPRSRRSCYLDRFAAIFWHLPDLVPAAAVGGEVDPTAIVRPAAHVAWHIQHIGILPDFCEAISRRAEVTPLAPDTISDRLWCELVWPFRHS